MALKQKITSRTKHWCVKYHFFWSYINEDDNNTKCERISTEFQKADYLTKGLPKITFAKCHHLNQGWWLTSNRWEEELKFTRIMTFTFSDNIFYLKFYIFIFTYLGTQLNRDELKEKIFNYLLEWEFETDALSWSLRS